jgi:hypothetical protein
VRSAERSKKRLHLALFLLGRRALVKTTPRAWLVVA